MTDQGIINIEDINTNIHTIGNKKIIAITKTTTLDKYLVCFKKNSIDVGVPSQQTIISKNHLVLHKDQMIKAKDFVDIFDNVNKIKYNGEVLYNVLMENHHTININNLTCETLNPKSGMATLQKILITLPPEKQIELINKANDYAIKNNIFTSKKLTK